MFSRPTWMLLMLLLVVCQACRSRNSNRVALPGAAVIDRASVNALAGTWRATKATNDLLAKKKYKADTIFLELRADSSFGARLPDCLDAAQKGGLSWDAIGRWKLYQDANAWKLGMSFEAGRLFRYRTFTTFDLVWMDSVLTISRFVGDPDKEQTLQFVKGR